MVEAGGPMKEITLTGPSLIPPEKKKVEGGEE
jgi:hypothetical protein